MSVQYIGKASPSVYLGMAAELSEMFAKAANAGFSHEQLIQLLEGQLTMERRLKASDDADQRSYG